ncbi:phytochelatin synthase family protein [Burkholderia pseudomallei]|uniref:phytochelatin synthase family protein n=1 Tax=Burkholderia pseudomallei TaxID=28450 RepID=UPI001A087F7A|nr:phytochelatin synthase family protein [Burkholderia pseudomallei]MBF3560007.1 phytochelatin synthase family protein [Burkholderia pseudomallei]MCV9911308.1 phytochelatin synthase family protein [Burkholderia pseudomallei]MCW0067457.1 phytochelatin synthase family protein [Burkholderia pseudomallei]
MARWSGVGVYVDVGVGVGVGIGIGDDGIGVGVGVGGDGDGDGDGYGGGPNARQAASVYRAAWHVPACRRAASSRASRYARAGVARAALRSSNDSGAVTVNTRLAGAVLAALALIGPAAAQPLPLPAGLIDLGSLAGEQMLAESGARSAYASLGSHFVTQKTQSYCGVASLVMVLNALRVPAPAAAQYPPFHYFTQDNVLGDATERIRPRALIERHGMTLDQLGALANALGASGDVRHASDVSVDVFRADAIAHLGRPGRYVLVNYLRSRLGQQTGGHISPLGAYDAAADRFLILDVSRYKYPPVWVTTADLYAAMNTPDADSGGRSRGYVLIDGVVAGADS